MIQRIQTVWLFISAVVSGFLMNGGIVNFVGKSGQRLYTGFSGIYKSTGPGHEIIKDSVLLAALIILIPVLSVITIFMYKNRRVQKIFSLILVSLSLIMTIVITYYSYFIAKNYEAALSPGIKMFLPLVILIAATLAYKSISRDDRIVKSYDRLR
jgi:hypothetical protein